MLGYMNAAALKITQETGRVTFFSRTRQTLWTKGETSGHYLECMAIECDCDRDTLLIRALPHGPTCHEGTTSCFGTLGPQGIGFLSYLEEHIAKRAKADAKQSYTATLLQGPIKKIAQKVGEEGVETALAGVTEDDAALKGEAADLIYHLLVLLNARNLNIEDVIDTLRARHK